MVNALTLLFTIWPRRFGRRRLMMNKSLRGRGRESSSNRISGFQLMGGQKKSRRFRRLLKLITGRRQTEWTGATRCPNEDNHSHKGESLILRKLAHFFRDYLPYRPVAEFNVNSNVVRAKARTHTPQPILWQAAGRLCI